MKTNSRKQFILVAALVVAFTLTTQAVVVSTNLITINVVGVINQAYASGAAYMVGPPLSIAPNDLNTLMPASQVPVGSAVWRMAPPPGNDYTIFSTNTANGWSSNLVFNAGEGFIFMPAGNYTNAWYGEVRQGNWTNTMWTGGYWNQISPFFPMGGNLNTNIMDGFPRSASAAEDELLHWDVSIEDWDSSIAQYRTRNNQRWWQNYLILPGESFLMQTHRYSTNPPTTNWVSFFTADGSSSYAPDYSTNLYVSITNVSTVPSGTSAVTTATLVLHHGGYYSSYTVLYSSCIGSNAYWMPLGSISSTATVTWTNTPNPDSGAWTTYGINATNVAYTNTGMPSMYFCVVANNFSGNPGGIGGINPMGGAGTSLEIHAASKDNNNTPVPFTPALYAQPFGGTYTTITPTPTSTDASQVPVYAFSAASSIGIDPTNIWTLNLGWSGEDYDYWLNVVNPPYPDSGWFGTPSYGKTHLISKAIYGLTNCANLTNFFASYNPIGNALDFSGLTNLKDIELFRAGPLPGINVTGCSSLWRLCVESCGIPGTLDLTGCTSLQDLRGAANNFTNIVFPSTHGNLVHICLRDDTSLPPGFVSSTLDNAFTGLQELLCWGDGQTGKLNLASTALTTIQVYSNQFTEINFTNCPNLKYLWAKENNLSSNAMEHILGEIYTNCIANLDPNAEAKLKQLYLGTASGNHYTTSNGYYFYDQIRSRCFPGSGSDGNHTIDRPQPASVNLGSTHTGSWLLCQSRAERVNELTFDFPVTAGNLLVCYVKCVSGDIAGIYDNQGNNWTEAPCGVVTYTAAPGITGYLHAYYATNCHSGTTYVTVTNYPSGVAMGISEISGAATTVAQLVGAYDYLTASGTTTWNSTTNVIYPTNPSAIGDDWGHYPANINGPR